MLNRIKFRIVGGEYAGKYVCNIESGKTVFFNSYFRPQEPSALDTCFSIVVEGSRTHIDFIGDNFLWNGKSLAPVVVAMNPGDTMTWEDHSIEVLDCPQIVSNQSDKTKFIDLSGVFKRGTIPPVPENPPPITHKHKEKQAAVNNEMAFTPIPKQSPSVIAPIPDLDLDGSFAGALARGEISTDSTVESTPVARNFESQSIDDYPPAAPIVRSGPSLEEKIAPAVSPKIKLNPMPEAALAKQDFEDKVVIKSSEVQKLVAQEEPSRIMRAPVSDKVIPLVPMNRSFGFTHQMATAFAILICFGAYAHQRFMVSRAPVAGATAWTTIPSNQDASSIPPVLADSSSSPSVLPEQTGSRGIASEVTAQNDFTTTSESVKPLESVATPIAPIEARASESEKQASIFAAIEANDLEAAKKLVEEDHLKLDFFDSTGKSPVTQAASMGRLSILKVFADNHADLNVKDSEGYSALMHAVLKERKSTISFLIEQGVDRKYKREDGKNAFAMAKEQNKELLKLFTQSRAPASVPVTDAKKEKRPNHKWLKRSSKK